jgi:cytochrome c oxidase cbb3-type subunit III
MSSFWSLWIIILTTVYLIGISWLLMANRKTQNRGPDATTGHVYDGIEEYDKPMPAWWIQCFVGTIIYGVGYLIAYPGMGNWPGVLGWTSTNQWEKEIDEAAERYNDVFAAYSATPIVELAKDDKAMRMAQRMFVNNCAQCHGADAGGVYGFPNLTDNDWLYGGSPEQIKASITDGRTAAMPQWANVVGDQGVREISSYVFSLNGREADQDLAAEGGKKFQMFCASCHGKDAKGNFAFGAPNLNDNVWLYGGSMGQIQHTLSNGRSGNMPAHAELLSDDKIHMLATYVYSLSKP